MSKSIFGAVTMVVFLAACASAQGHDHGAQAPGANAAQAADSSGMMQQRMQRMEQRMESMQQMRQQHMQQGGMQGMRRMQEGGMQGMQAMGSQQQTRARDQSCLASSQQAGLSALLLGSTTDLALTDQQKADLEEILLRAQRDALDKLTAEQRQQLEDAPAAPATCPRATQATPPAN